MRAINGYDLSGFCGLFGNPFKKCKDPEPEFDVGTIDRSTGEVVSLAPRTGGNFPNNPIAAVQYNLEIIEGAADATTVIAAGAAFTPCSSPALAVCSSVRALGWLRTPVLHSFNAFRPSISAGNVGQPFRGSCWRKLWSGL